MICLNFMVTFVVVKPSFMMMSEREKYLLHNGSIINSVLEI